MSRLRQYLERQGPLAPAELQSALQRQQIYGGSLDTCLLELELVDPNLIDDMLSRACGLPSAPRELVAPGLERPWTSVPANLVDSGWIIPLHVDGQQVLIAVHPDLPDDKLGALYRSVPGMRPMVVPEYCLVRLAAERMRSVMPQRYAILDARFSAAARPRAMPGYPSEPTIPDVGYAGDEAEASAEATIPDGMAVDPDLMARPDAGFVAPDTTVVPPPSYATFEPSATAAEPEVYEVRGWAAVDTAKKARVVDAAALLEAVAPHRKALEEARERDAATDALARCAMAVSPRVALFGVKRDGLLALRTPCLLVTVPEQTLVPVHAGSDLAKAIDGEQVMDRLSDLDLRLAVGHESAVPCFFEGVEVRGRRVLMLYVDRDGERLDPLEVEILRDVCDVAGTTLEEVLKLRHARMSAEAADAAQGPSPPAPEPPEPAPEPSPPTQQTEPAAQQAPAREAWKHPGAVPQKKAAEERDIRSAQPGQWIAPPAPQAPLPPGATDRRTLEKTPPPPAGEPLTLTAQISHEPPPVRTGGTLPSGMTPVQPSFRPPPLPHDQQGRTEAAGADDTVPAPPLEEQHPQLKLPSLVGHDELPIPRLVQPDARHRGPTMGLPGTTPTLAAPLEARGPTTEQLLPEPPPPSHGYEHESDFADVMDDGPKLLTIDASPPPPVLPPPPEAETRGRERPKTLSGLPPEPSAVPTRPPLPATEPEPEAPPSSAAQEPQAAPPAVDEEPEAAPAAAAEEPEAPSAAREEPEAPPPPAEPKIVSLSSPIVEPTTRARITLDDEDRVAPPHTTEDDARIDGLVDDLRAGKDVGAELVAMGQKAMERLTERFPGPLEVLRRDLAALPPPSAHGPLLRAVIAMGGHVVPHLLRLFINPSPDVRFYAAFVFQELRDGRCMRPMASLAFDPDAEVRIIAMRVLETYCRAPAFGSATSIVRAQLGSENRTRQLQAARAVGTLRDVDAIDPLIGLLSSKDRYVQEAALESLCSITGQQHGLKPHRWRQWFVEHGGGHRVEWIVESLRHKDLPVRRWAYDELLRITGHRIPFEPSGERKEREVAAREWMEWWTSEGRDRLTTPQ